MSTKFPIWSPQKWLDLIGNVHFSHCWSCTSIVLQKEVVKFYLWDVLRKFWRWAENLVVLCNTWAGLRPSQPQAEVLGTELWSVKRFWDCQFEILKEVTYKLRCSLACFASVVKWWWREILSSCLVRSVFVWNCPVYASLVKSILIRPLALFVFSRLRCFPGFVAEC